MRLADTERMISREVRLFCTEEFTRISTGAGELGRRKRPGSDAPDRFGKEEQLGQESKDPFLCQTPAGGSVSGIGEDIAGYESLLSGYSYSGWEG